MVLRLDFAIENQLPFARGKNVPTQSQDKNAYPHIMAVTTFFKTTAASTKRI